MLPGSDGPGGRAAGPSCVDPGSAVDSPATVVLPPGADIHVTISPGDISDCSFCNYARIARIDSAVVCLQGLFTAMDLQPIMIP